MTRSVRGSRDGRWAEQNKRKMPPHLCHPLTQKKRKLKEGWWEQLWRCVDELKNWERKTMAPLAEVKRFQRNLPGNCLILKSPKVKHSDWWHAAISRSIFTYLTAQSLFLVGKLAFANRSTDWLTALHAVIWDLCWIFSPAQNSSIQSEHSMWNWMWNTDAGFRSIKRFDSATKQAEKQSNQLVYFRGCVTSAQS